MCIMPSSISLFQKDRTPSTNSGSFLHTTFPSVISTKAILFRSPYLKHTIMKAHGLFKASSKEPALGVIFQMSICFSTSLLKILQWLPSPVKNVSTRSTMVMIHNTTFFHSPYLSQSLIVSLNSSKRAEDSSSAQIHTPVSIHHGDSWCPSAYTGISSFFSLPVSCITPL